MEFDNRVTNALAARVGAGDRQAVLPLWEQVRCFAAYRANNFCSLYRMQCGWMRFEPAELEDEAFLVMLKAAGKYDPDRGAFLALFSFHLKQAFRVCAGWIRNCRKDPLESALSGNVPVSDGEGGDLEMEWLDTFPDDAPGVEETATEDLYRAQLREALDGAMEALTAKQREVLALRYYHGLSMAAAARELGCSHQCVADHEKKALETLYQNREENGLWQFGRSRAQRMKMRAPERRTARSMEARRAELARERDRKPARARGGAETAVRRSGAALARGWAAREYGQGGAEAKA